MDDEGKLLLIRGRRQKLAMAAMGLVLLVAGVLLAPADDQSKPTSAVPQEPVAPLLASEASDPMAGFQRWLDVGTRALQFTVSIAVHREPAAARSRFDVNASTPATTAPGVLVRSGQVLTHGDVFAAQAFTAPLRVLTPEGRHSSARVERCDPESGLVLLSVEGLDRTEPAALAGRPIGNGTPAVAASRLGARPLVQPILVTGFDQGRFRPSLGNPPPGTAVFDVDGRLLGLAGSAGVGWTAEAALSRLDGLRPPVPLSLGLTLQPITEDLRPFIEPPGVLVAAVDPATAGVLPGDVLLRIDDAEIATLADYDRALAGKGTTAPVALTLRRGPNTVSQAVHPRPTCVTPAVTEAPVAAATAGTVFEDSAIRSAGLPPGAAVLEVDGREAGLWRPRRRAAALVRAQAAGQPPAFYVVRP